jgi:ribosomal protein L11 methyltransferase
LAERLRDLAPGGISIEEPYVPLGPEEGARLESWRPTTLKLYLPVDERLGERRRLIDAELAALPFSVTLAERDVHQEDWAESWKEFFQVERAGRRIVIRPSWRSYESQPGEVVLDLDPGMAFGTGQHPTTRLCLGALEELIRPGMDLLDLGCGSGILSVAAAKLGCTRVVALDIEAVAVDATRANAAANGVDSAIRCEGGSLGDAWPFTDRPDRSADMVVANISAAALVRLAQDISASLRPAGIFVGSGIIGERTDEVLVALAAAGLQTEDIRAEGDWRAVIARRPPVESLC